MKHDYWSLRHALWRNHQVGQFTISGCVTDECSGWGRSGTCVACLEKALGEITSPALAEQYHKMIKQLKIVEGQMEKIVEENNAD